MYLERALALSDPPPAAGFYHGKVMMDQQRFNRALISFQITTRLAPDHAAAWYYQGLVHRQLENNDQACQALSKACQLRPNRVRYHYAYANALKIAGRTNDAVAALSVVIEKDAMHRRARYSRGLLHFRQGTYRLAEGDFRQALKLRPHGYRENYMVGLCLLKMDAHDSAIPFFMASFAAEKDVKSAYNLGLAYERSGDIQEAIDSFHKALQIEPKHAPSMRRLAVVYETLGADQDARSHARRLLMLQDKASPHSGIDGSMALEDTLLPIAGQHVNGEKP